MKRVLCAAALAIATVPALAADIGVSINVGQPGFFGRIDIGNFPQPQVVNVQPVIIGQVPMNRPPLYLHVPPGHIKHWKKHCHEYNACGERVFFVRDDWYNREYVPHYQEQHRGRGDMRHDDRHDDHRGDRRDDRRGDDHDRGR
jgi:hypothetical protein